MVTILPRLSFLLLYGCSDLHTGLLDIVLAIPGPDQSKENPFLPSLLPQEKSGCKEKNEGKRKLVGKRVRKRLPSSLDVNHFHCPLWS